MKTDTDGLIQWIEQQETLQGLNDKKYATAIKALTDLWVRTANAEYEADAKAQHEYDDAN